MQGIQIIMIFSTLLLIGSYSRLGNGDFLLDKPYQMLATSETSILTINEFHTKDKSQTKSFEITKWDVDKHIQIQTNVTLSDTFVRTPTGISAFADFKLKLKPLGQSPFFPIDYVDICSSLRTTAFSDGLSILTMQDHRIQSLIKGIDWLDPWQLSPDGKSFIVLKVSGHKTLVQKYDIFGKKLLEKHALDVKKRHISLTGIYCDLIWANSSEVAFFMKSRHANSVTLAILRLPDCNVRPLAEIDMNDPPGAKSDIGVPVKGILAKYKSSLAILTRNKITFAEY
jgi:hypothetical protein